MKEILLINPPGLAQGVSSMPTLGMLWLASYLRKYGFNPHFVDGWVVGWKGIEEAIIKHQPDIVGITGITGVRHNSFKAADIAKRINPEVLVVFGGIHATIMWKQVLENYSSIDIVVRGEGEQTLLEIAQGKPLENIDGISYRKNVHVVRNKERQLITNLDDIPLPAWDLHDLRLFSAANDADEDVVVNGIEVSKEIVAPIMFSRGCPGRCNFCSTWWMWKQCRSRSAENMVNEIEYLYNKFNIRHFKFLDDCFGIDRNVTIKFCDELEKRKLRIAFAGQTRGDCIDPELLERLYAVGNYILLIGVESGSQKILDIMSKSIDLRKLENNIMTAKKIGFKINELLIAGNIGETIDTVNETIEFVKRTDPHTTSVGHGLMIFPGTIVYNHAKKIGMVDDDFWLSDRPYMMYTYEHSEAMLHSFANAILNRKKLPKSKTMIALRNHRFFTKSLVERTRSKMGIRKEKNKGTKGYYPR